MPTEKWDEKLNRANEYERGDVTYNIPPEKFGWIPTPPELKEQQLRLYNLDNWGLSVPAAGAVENPLYYPTHADGQNIVDAYNQIGGTCVGASGAQATTARNSKPGDDKLYDYMALYCQCRKLMGDGACNKNAGATMQSVGRALQEWGGVRIIGGKKQPASTAEGIVSYSFGYDADSIRTALGNGIYIQIGIPVYQAMLSPKLIRNAVTGQNEYWIYWQTGSWGSMLGGHAMFSYWWSDQRNAFFLPNTWGFDWCEGKGSWLSRASFTRLRGAAMAAEILICVDRDPGPQSGVGKLELAEPFTIAPWPLKVGDKATAHLKVKNTGDGKLTGVGLAIEDMKNGLGGPGFGFTPDFDLEPGAVYDHNPTSDTPVSAGHWRFRGDYRKDGRYTVLGTVEADVTDEPEPPPPPPPPTDHLTVDIAIHTADANYKLDGVEVPRV